MQIKGFSLSRALDLPVVRGWVEAVPELKTALICGQVIGIAFLPGLRPSISVKGMDDELAAKVKALGVDVVEWED